MHNTVKGTRAQYCSKMYKKSNSSNDNLQINVEDLWDWFFGFFWPLHFSLPKKVKSKNPLHQCVHVIYYRRYPVCQFLNNSDHLVAQRVQSVGIPMFFLTSCLAYTTYLGNCLDLKWTFSLMLRLWPETPISPWNLHQGPGQLKIRTFPGKNCQSSSDR